MILCCGLLRKSYFEKRCDPRDRVLVRCSARILCTIVADAGVCRVSEQQTTTSMFAQDEGGAGYVEI